MVNTAFTKFRVAGEILLLCFADEDWHLFCFEGKGLVI